jgi:hypothetical protein
MSRYNDEMKKIVLTICLVLVFLDAKVFALSIPETMKYELSVGSVPIGYMTLAAKNAGENVELEATMSTLAWASLFYEVNDHVVSMLKKSPSKGRQKSFPYSPAITRISINEGPLKADIAIIFSQTRKTITYLNVLANDKALFKMKDTTLDPLTALYYIRHVPLTPGKPVSFRAINNNVILKVVASHIRRETITTPLGTFHTILMKVDIYFDGPGVKYYYPGDLYVWLTDDERKMPVLIEKKLPALAEGKLPGLVMDKMPDYLKKKLKSGLIRATLVP